MGSLNPFRETKFSGTNGDREIISFSGPLTTSRIGNLTRLIDVNSTIDSDSQIIFEPDTKPNMVHSIN